MQFVANYPSSRERCWNGYQIGLADRKNWGRRPLLENSKVMTSMAITALMSAAH